MYELSMVHLDRPIVSPLPEAVFLSRDRGKPCGAGLAARGVPSEAVKDPRIVARHGHPRGNPALPGAGFETRCAAGLAVLNATDDRPSQGAVRVFGKATLQEARHGKGEGGELLRAYTSRDRPRRIGG